MKLYTTPHHTTPRRNANADVMQLTSTVGLTLAPGQTSLVPAVSRCRQVESHGNGMQCISAVNNAPTWAWLNQFVCEVVAAMVAALFNDMRCTHRNTSVANIAGLLIYIFMSQHRSHRAAEFKTQTITLDYRRTCCLNDQENGK